ncbi:hypothetical protein IV203_036760 [Nitzschia inconspicua]|uniref:Amino acid transporter transmembrane domain-containing protein n=1 Tax=Nitzschia inconspicua TaxID=303405 RepID=A0A9K3LH96_9STRA|nr:hypothetical protein IV203_036760 [Nitzschia inconspicua]
MNSPSSGTSERTPLIRNVGSTNDNNRTVDFSYTNGDESKISPTGDGKKSFLHLSLQRSASTFSDAVSSMRRIGYLGSMSIAVNSLTGPAMLALPDTYQRSGLIPTTLVIIFVCVLSALCCLHMSNTISKVPGNSNFTNDIGFSECFRYFWGQRSFMYTQLLFFCCITCLNVSSIVDTAQVVDTFLGHWVPGGSAAVNFRWTESGMYVRLINWNYETCSDEMMITGECVPFLDNNGMLFTMGYAITLLIFLPMALMDLKENAAVQVVGFIVLLVTSLGFIILFFQEGVDFVDGDVSLWGTEWGSLFGVVLFNFALVVAIPAWLYEKEPDVDVPTVVHSSSILSAALYIVIGVLGATSMPYVSQNMLESLMSGAFGTIMQLCASVFAFFIIGLGCPLFSVLTRMNLAGSGLVSHRTANGLAVYLPFLTSWVFYQGDAITQLLSWGGIIFTSLIAFVLPLLLALHALDVCDDEVAVAVYSPFSITTKKSQQTALKVLLVLAVLAILAAIFGNVFNDDIASLVEQMDKH